MSSNNTTIAGAADWEDAPRRRPEGIMVCAIAKGLGLKSKQVLEKAQQLYGKEKVKRHTSLLNPGQADRIIGRLKKGGAQ